MLTRLRKRLSYANIVASLALFIALGGVGYAATASKNSVRSSSIKDGQVKAADLASNAVTSAKIKNGQVANADLGANAVKSANIADGSVARADIAPGAAGLRAFGSVTSTGVLSASQGIASINHPQTGVYCIAFTSGLGITKDSLVVPTLKTIGGDTSSHIELRWETAPILCAAGALTLINFDSVSFADEDHAFFVLVP